MPIPFRGELIFAFYVAFAVLIGICARVPRRAFLYSLGLGMVVCFVLYFVKVFIEMGGILHAMAVATLSMMVCKSKQLWPNRSH